jgi:hypothetical protein
MQRQTQPGQLLFQHGERCDDFFVIVSGKVAVVGGVGNGLRQQDTPAAMIY